MRQLTTIFSAFLLLLGFSSCNKQTTSNQNPFFEEWTSNFGIPPFDKIRAEHYAPAFEAAMESHNAEIQAIVNNPEAPTFENVILAYDNAGKELSKVNNVFGLLSSADTNEQMDALRETISPRLSAHSDAIRMNDALFAKVKNIYDNRQNASLDDEQTRLLTKIYTAFVRSGALLTPEQKEHLTQINGELSLLGVKFGANLLAENNNFVLVVDDKEKLTGLTNSMITAARAKAEELKLGADTWAFTPHFSNYLAFMTYSANRELRKEMLEGYTGRGNHDDQFDNKQLINEMLRLRTEKAKMLGYRSYADYITSDQMAKSPEAADEFLKTIWEPALLSAKDECAEMNVLLQKDEPGATFQAWDWFYYAEQLRKEKYDLDEEMLKPYFSLDNVQRGAFMLANRLYGITFRPIAAPLYNPDVVSYEVLDADNTHLGVLMLDYFVRPSKSQGAWCGSYVEQSYEGDQRIAPVVTNVFNFAKPTSKSTPALLTLDEVGAVFHEFGHALHALFAEVKYNGLGGVEGDFVELPSQVMENWAFEPEMLRLYATHYRNNEIIPDDLIEKIRRSALFNQGFMTVELTAASLSDLELHSMSDYKPFDVNQAEQQILNKELGLISQIEPRYHYTYFAHIFDGGYASGYYFYLWAEQLDKDAFEAFRESGDLFNRQIAAKFRKEVLSRGGSADGMSLYRAFRGTDPDKKAMLRGRGLLKDNVASDSKE